MPDLWQASH